MPSRAFPEAGEACGEGIAFLDDIFVKCYFYICDSCVLTSSSLYGDMSILPSMFLYIIVPLCCANVECVNVYLHRGFLLHYSYYGLMGFESVFFRRLRMRGAGFRGDPANFRS
jgi:hypothetical protein